MNPAARVAIGAISAYRSLLSPFLGRHCRYMPSCSEYAAMAIEDWGVARGGWFALRRIARCHPWSRSGLDLPPRNPTVRTNGGA